MDLRIGNNATSEYSLDVYRLGYNLRACQESQGVSDQVALRAVTEELEDETSVAGHARAILAAARRGEITPNMPWVGFASGVLRHYYPREFDPQTAQARTWDRVKQEYDRLFEALSCIPQRHLAKVIVSASQNHVVLSAVELGVSSEPRATCLTLASDGSIFGVVSDVVTTDWGHFIEACKGFGE